MTQQPFSQVLHPARSKTVVENHIHKPVLDNPNTQTKSSAGTSLQILQKRFANGEKCKCPEEFVIPVRPRYADYVEDQCQICQNSLGKEYD